MIFPKKNSKSIAVDLYTLRNRNVGLGEYSYQFGKELATRSNELNSLGIRLVYFVPKGYSGLFGDGIEYKEISRNERIFYFLFGKRYSLFHTLHQYGLFVKRCPGEFKLLTIHDINFIYEKKPSKIVKYSTRLERIVNRFNNLAYISNFVRQDVDKHFNFSKPVRVIYNGVAKLQEPVLPQGRQLPASGYLFHISSLMPKKNPDLLIRMMKYLPNEKLVIVGNWGTSYGNKLKSLIKELELNNITALDHVSEAEKAYLYANCKAFLFPSLCEGFGMPPIEAMHFGKEVFLSTLTSLPEVGGELANYFDTLEPEKMAEKVKAVFDRQESRGDDISAWAAQFSWEKCIDGYIQLYKEILGIDKDASANQ